MMRMTTQELNELVKKLREQDEQAQVILYMSMHKQMLALAKWFGLNEHDAYDAVSNAFVKATTKIGQYTDNTNFRGWVLRIVRNEAVNLKRINEKNYLDEDFIIKCLVDDGMEEEITTEQRDNALRREFDALPEMQRKCCQLHYLERLTIKETAETLGVSPNTVKTNVRLGFEKLKTILEQKGGRDAWYTTHGIAIAPLLASLLRQDIASGLYDIPAEVSEGILQAAGVAQSAAILAYTEVAEATATATTSTAATTTAATTTATTTATTAATGTAASTTAAATGAGLIGKFAALGVAAKAAIVTTAAAVVVAGVAVPVHIHNENEKAEQAAIILQQEQEEAERLAAEEAERIRLEEEVRAVEEEAARIEAERIEAERIAAEEEAAQLESEAEAERIAAEEAEVVQEVETEPEATTSQVVPSNEEGESQPNGVPEVDLVDTFDRSGIAPERGVNVAEEILKSDLNPYVGQPEPAGGCPNPVVETAIWDSSIGAWRCTFDGRPVAVTPDGGVYQLD